MNDSNPSMMSHDEQEDWHDELVAYLDGEVSTEERERIEQRLTDDDAYRSQLVELERSWRLLDRLPTAEQDRDFTKSTIAMVAADLSGTGANAADGKRDGAKGFQIPWAKLLATAVACAIGFLAVVFAVVLPNRGQLTTSMQDLAVAQNFDLYRYTGNIDFLKVMHEEGLFRDDASDTASASADWSHTINAQKIRNSIEKLDESEKQELAKRRERFTILSDDKKTRARKMHQQLVADKDKTTLFRTMQGHRDWLAKLPSAERVKLQDIKDPKERVEKIRELRQNSDSHEPVATSADELKEFYLNTLSSEQRDELKQLPDDEMQIELRKMFLEDRE